MKLQVITFGILLSLLTLNKAQSDCNYLQNMEPGKAYYIYNQEYPNFYRANNTCTWRLRSPYVMKINCTIYIPETNNCMQDKLLVRFDGKDTNTYCGAGKFENKGINVTINFNSPFYTLGGRFLCEIKTIEFDEDNCQCGWKDLTHKSNKGEYLVNPKKPFSLCRDINATKSRTNHVYAKGSSLSVQSYIVGGKETGVNEYTMMAGLVDSVIEELYCGASIISQRHVVTAAHCLTNKNPNEIGVIIGEHDVTTGWDTNVTKLYRINKYVIHPQYDGNYNDIAVCEIWGKFQYGVKIGPACLPFYHKNDLFIGSYVKLLGWGMMTFGGAKSDVLQEVDVRIISPQQCANSYNKWISDSQICTYTEGKDACQMDSGGPVLWENPTTRKLVLIGIISNGVGCASELPAINTRVGNYIPWIMHVTPGIQYCKME